MFLLVSFVNLLLFLVFFLFWVFYLLFFCLLSMVNLEYKKNSNLVNLTSHPIGVFGVKLG